MMIYKALYFVTVLALCSIVRAEMPLQNESEKFSPRMTLSAAVIQSENSGKIKIMDIQSVNEDSEQPLKSNRLHSLRAPFRKRNLMMTQPIEAIGISDIDTNDVEEDPDMDDLLGAQEEETENEEAENTVEGVHFREFFNATNLFTELSYLPTSTIQLQTKG